MIKLITILVVLSLCGCSSTQQNQNVLNFLERAKADGNINITTSGALSVGQRVSFFAGAHDTTVAFDGHIDFSEPVLREDEEIENE